MSLTLLCLLPSLFYSIVSGSHDVLGHHRLQKKSSDYLPRQDSLTKVKSDRLELIVSGLSTLTLGVDPNTWTPNFQNGQWKDVDYTTGCNAQRANWPATVHWLRTATLAAAWHGGLPNAESLANNNDVKNTVLSAMSWWFSHDFTNNACLDKGGTDACPCSNPDGSMWNPNWFANVIGVPMRVAEACLLLGKDNLDDSHLNGCTRMTGRSYGEFYQGLSALTGANTLDVSKIGIDLGLLTSNTTLIAEAYSRIHGEMKLQSAFKNDGIQSDGSFGQHAGILYNGNYGKDFANDILNLEIPAAGTEYAANTDTQNAFSDLIDADHWMIYLNTETKVLHWDFSVLNRFIVLPVADAQATGSLNINVSQVGDLGQQWSSSALTNFASQLTAQSTSANAGDMRGNRMFYTSDYMVHRGSGYISTVKMFSSRSLNSECVNNQNPFGFHLSDGALRTYVTGSEYEDIAAAMDWNLVPGITVDYGATQLKCDSTTFTGKENFVGGVSDGTVGAAAMRYTNPSTGSLQFQKAWFFLQDDVQHVMISNIVSKTSSPVVSVLDQKKHSGSVLVDGNDIAKRDLSGTPHPGAKSLWHDNIGYVFDAPDQVTLNVQVGNKQGSWKNIGTSTQPDITVDLFTAYLTHNSPSTPISYTAFPGTTTDDFNTRQQNLKLQTLQNDGHISAIYDGAHSTAMVVFWDSNGGSLQISPSGQTSVKITSTAAAALIYDFASSNLTLSDPSQTSKSVSVSMNFGDGTAKNVNFDLSTGPNGISSSQPVLASTKGKDGGAGVRISVVYTAVIIPVLSLLLLSS